MLTLVLYYLFFPVLLGLALIVFVQTFGKKTTPAWLVSLYAQHPMEPKTFRVVRASTPDGPATLVGDFESLESAVDAAYRGRAEARRAAGEPCWAYLVLDSTAACLEELDV